MSSISWNTSLVLSQFIYSLATYNSLNSNYNFFTAGTFEQAPTINADTNQGTCGNGSQSCLLARYESSTWSKVFTTDSSVNVMTLTSRISARVN